MSIAFNRDFAFEYGRVDQVAPGIRRVVARNPGPFTYTGTGVYIVGSGQVAVIDPGPSLDEHENALMAALAGEQVSHIFITHHHLDHTPLARGLAERFGARTYGFGAPLGGGSSGDGDVRLEAGDDHSFSPDQIITDGDTFSGTDWTIEAIHTPGHTSNHMCYAFLEQNALFCGDHVMAWSTSVVSPPDGDMGDYLASLERVRERGFDTLWPAHGPSVDNPRDFIGDYIAHRRQREAQIIAQLEAGRTKIKDMVTHMYADVDKRLHPAAAHSVLAHLIHLVKEGRVETEGAPGLASLYRLRAYA